MDSVYRRALVVVALLLSAFALSNVGHAGDLGADAITDEEMRGVPEWRPADEGTGVLPNIDLRYAVRDGRQVRVLPRVGRQHDNSCVGWAVAYAAKSFNEAFDQEWVPNTPERIFSPAFVYNRINGGRDRGSSTVRAMRLLVDDGCATMATMPYTGDFKRQPSRAALDEARQYRISHFSHITTGSAIRSALAQGHVVVLVVRTDPIFNGGRYDVFTPGLRRKADASLPANTQHRYHAMCVVGYDDTRQAFLVMNSWGDSWRGFDTNYEGHTWVHYDLLRELRRDPGYFGQAAFVLHDIHEKLDDEPTPPDTPQPDGAITASGGVRYAGLRGSAHTWYWTARLAGTRRALEGVRKVTWRVPTGTGQVRSYDRSSPSDAFAIHGVHTGSGSVHINGTALFYDGSTKDVRQVLRFNAPKKRSLTLEQTDRYWGRKGNQPYWEWAVKVVGSLTDLADVKQVTYHLHPTFPNPDRVVTSSPRNGFAYTTRGWGTFEVRATVEFKDGSTQKLATNLAFDDEVRDKLTLTNTSRHTGTTRFGKDWYDWTAYIDGPLVLLREIHFVRYRLHPTFTPNTLDVQEGGDFGYPLSRSGWGTFELVADVHMRDGFVFTLKHTLTFDPTNKGGGGEK